MTFFVTFVLPFLKQYWKIVAAVIALVVWHLFVYYAGVRHEHKNTVKWQTKYEERVTADAKEQLRLKEGGLRAQQELERKAAAAKAARDARAAAVANDARNAAADNPIILTPGDVRVFDDARAAAESARAAGELKAPAPPASESAQAYIAALNAWAGACIERDALWRMYYDDLLNLYTVPK